MCLTSLPTSSTMPEYSWPIGCGSVIGAMPRYGHRSDPHTQAAETRRMASVGSRIVGSGRSSRRTSPRPWRIVPCMIYLLLYLLGLLAHEHMHTSGLDGDNKILIHCTSIHSSGFLTLKHPVFFRPATSPSEGRDGQRNY